jgi:hypothetical protein
MRRKRKGLILDADQYLLNAVPDPGFLVNPDPNPDRVKIRGFD